MAVGVVHVSAAEGLAENTGHFHVLVDAPAPAAGEAIPFDETHLHYGKGQTAADVPLGPVSGCSLLMMRGWRGDAGWGCPAPVMVVWCLPTTTTTRRVHTKVGHAANRQPHIPTIHVVPA